MEMSNEAFNLLKELNRTMKPGSWIRITVPDLRKYVQYYCDKSDKSLEKRFFEEWNTGCEAIRSLTQSYWHLSTWPKHRVGATKCSLKLKLLIYKCFSC